VRIAGEHAQSRTKLSKVPSRPLESGPQPNDGWEVSHAEPLERAGRYRRNKLLTFGGCAVEPRPRRAQIEEQPPSTRL
jgi:hypothetical protein